MCYFFPIATAELVSQCTVIFSWGRAGWKNSVENGMQYSEFHVPGVKFLRHLRLDTPEALNR